MRMSEASGIELDLFLMNYVLTMWGLVVVVVRVLMMLLLVLLIGDERIVDDVAAVDDEGNENDCSFDIDW